MPLPTPTVTSAQPKIRRPARSGVIAVALDSAHRRRLETALGRPLTICPNWAEAERLLRQPGVQKGVGLLLTTGRPQEQAATVMPLIRTLVPEARAALIGTNDKASDAVDAFRGGFIDYLAADDLADDDQLAARLDIALRKADELARQDRRMNRLRRTVRKLNAARRQVSQRVDVLCGDLVGAYGELSKQMDELRLRQDLLNGLENAGDLEELLCQKMDWLLRRLGHCNIAIFLTGDDGQQELGAYMKYTVAGDPPLTDALANNLARIVQDRGSVHAAPEALVGVLSPAELPHLHGQTVLATDCLYLAESLATIICFRDGREPFKPEEADALRAAAPHFAAVLAQTVRQEVYSDDEDQDEGFDPDDAFPLDDLGGDLLDEDDEDDDADWWKQSDRTPF
jgi:hypothetical protein